MTRQKLPSISVLIPTLNAASVLNECLKTVTQQDYPEYLVEIIVADGGSMDGTLNIAEKYGAKIHKNPLKTGEAGKAVALRHAQGELVVLIDSDNILPDKNWLRQMVEPFLDAEIVGSEPWEFTWRRTDGFIDRYCALFGMNDPICYFLGNYDRRNILSGKWTGLPVGQEDKRGWIKVTLKPDVLPTIGANGAIFRRLNLVRGLTSQGNQDYLFDIDIIASLAAKKPVKFAKVKTGIVHLYCGSDIGKFVRKQKRRIRDYLYYQKIGVRNYPWQKQNKSGFLKFILACITIWPLVYQAAKGYFKKPDLAWFFHPLACWCTLFIYGWIRLTAVGKVEQMERDKWGQ